ncbi:MAG: DUF3794 domain-containing protein [Eubacteriales bacterium]
MELVQKSIQVNTMAESITHQFHIGEDMNVPDAKEDVVRILQTYGKIHIKDIQKLEQYLKIKGELEYQILYATEDEERRVACMEGKTPMEEMVYVENLDEEYVVKCNQMDMNATLIHSRKINMKTLVELEIQKSQVKTEDITIDVASDSDVLKRYVTTPILELNMSKKDTYRIKEEVKLPGTKENIGSMLLHRIGNMQLDTRVAQDELLLHGEFQFFCMYISDEWKEDYVAQSVTFEGKISCVGMDESMFHHLSYEIDDISVDTQMDEDGEVRILNIEATIKMDIKVYEERDYEILDDLYMLEKKCELSRNSVYVESLLLQNQSKCKVIETLALPELRDDLLQICTANGMVQLEQIEVEEGRIELAGILHVDVLYVRSDDRYPYASWQGMIPFSHSIECPNAKDVVYNIESYLEQVAVTMSGNGELEVKAVVNFHGFMRKAHLLEVIDKVEIEDFTLQELEEQAGIIGYIYKDDDNMWDLAKKFHTTADRILKNNKISEKEMKGGQKLLIFKENVSIL